VRLLPFLLIAACLLSAGCSSGGEDQAEAGQAASTTTTTAETSAATATAATSSTGGPAPMAAIPQIVRDVQPSVVTVKVSNGEGSGVIFEADGTILTNNHVVEGAESVQIVFASGETAAAEVVATDPLSDLAVVRADRAGLPAARFSETPPEVGELAIAMGNPLGFENSVTSGIVSGLNRAVPAQGEEAAALVDLIQTDAPISPGNSGGALVNINGQVMGINVAYIPPEARAVSIGFAIPAATAIDVARQLLDTGEAEHAFLGVSTTELTPQIAQRFGIDASSGLVVLSVVESSGAGRAGIEAGDVITAIDGQPVQTVGDLLSLLRRHSPGDRLELRVLREGAEQTLTVELTDRP
jgi:S1-C subfamily serine protease